MTNTQGTPAGWYQDANDPRQLRWWDGTQWTDATQTPYDTAGGAGLAATTPADTNTKHVWAIIGVFVLQLILSLVFMATFDWDAYMRTSLSSTTGLESYSFILSPGYLAIQALSVLGYAATVAFAYFDAKQLGARGVQRPFPWALSFIPSYGATVYIIGRSVVVRRRTGGGLAPLWVYIAVFVIGMIASFVVVFAAFGSIFASMPSYTGY
jgi:hypothetical protein